MDKRLQTVLIAFAVVCVMIGCAPSEEHTEPKLAEPMQSCVQAPETPVMCTAQAQPTMVKVSLPEVLQPGSILLDADSTPLENREEGVRLEFTDEEKDLLLRIAMAEVGGEECTECLALVMRVVLNRVESGQFGGTIRGVIYSEGQFTPVENGAFDHAGPTQRCHDALEMVMNGWDESQGALYFESNPGTSWHTYNCEYLFRHCSTRFYKQKEQNDAGTQS